MTHLIVPLLFAAFLGACSDEIRVVVGDGAGIPCGASILEGANFDEIGALEAALSSAGNARVVIYPNPGTSERCIADAKAAAVRAGKHVEIKIETE